MAIRTRIECPKCAADLVVKRGGVCPSCGTPISDHVARVRARERRIEQALAIVASAAVLALFLFTSGIGLIEGIVAYAAVGAAIFFLSRRTFF
jgi:hypothetical protein